MEAAHYLQRKEVEKRSERPKRSIEARQGRAIISEARVKRRCKALALHSEFLVQQLKGLGRAGCLVAVASEGFVSG